MESVTPEWRFVPTFYGRRIIDEHGNSPANITVEIYALACAWHYSNDHYLYYLDLHPWKPEAPILRTISRRDSNGRRWISDQYGRLYFYRPELYSMATMYHISQDFEPLDERMERLYASQRPQTLFQHTLDLLEHAYFTSEER